MNELFKTPFGSRLYGTATPTSDYDWKIIVLPAIDDLLLGNKVVGNTFYSTASQEVKNTSDDTDTEIVPIQTFARDVLKGQSYAIELAFAVKNWANIPGTQVVDSRIINFVDQLVDNFLNNQMSGMVGYAYHQAELYGAKGERLNLLTELLGVMRTFADTDDTIHNLTERNMDFRIAMSKITGNATYKNWIEHKAIHIDSTNNLYYSLIVLKKTYLGTTKTAHLAKILEKTISAYGKRANEAAKNEGNDWKALSHAVRVTHQAIELLCDGTITLPFKPELASLLVDIKLGKVEFTEVSHSLTANVDIIDGLKEFTLLQPYTETLREKFDNWLVARMREFYSIQ